MEVHIVAIAYDDTVSAIARVDIGALINDLIDNHGTDGEDYDYTETPEGIEKVIEQIEDETGYFLTYNVQEVGESPKSVWPEGDDERIAYVDWQYEVTNGDTPVGFREWYDNPDRLDPGLDDTQEN